MRRTSSIHLLILGAALWLSSAHPSHADLLKEQLSLMDQHIESYQDIVKQGGWPSLSSRAKLTPGITHEAIAELRNILQITGDIPKEPSSFWDRADKKMRATEALDSALATQFYDADLLEAVKTFQRRHGLKDDGIIGPATRAAINTPAHERLAQLKLTKQKLGEFLADYTVSEHAILVNIPAYRVYLLEHGDEVGSMRAIVGKKKRQTHEFSKQITYMEFNPLWYVPPKIAKKDILPKIQKDPSFVSRAGFTLTQDGVPVDATAVDWSQMSEGHFPFRLTQGSGGSNALGKVKFHIPDNRAIYLHDTSKPYLFKRDNRALSSGCVRVEDPLILSQFVLGHGKSYTPDEAAKAYKRAKRRGIKLEKPIDTHSVYWTAWADPASDKPYFYDDVYGMDRRDIKNLMADMAGI